MGPFSAAMTGGVDPETCPAEPGHPSVRAIFSRSDRVPATIEQLTHSTGAAGLHFFSRCHHCPAPAGHFWKRSMGCCERRVGRFWNPRATGRMGVMIRWREQGPPGVVAAVGQVVLRKGRTKAARSLNANGTARGYLIVSNAFSLKSVAFRTLFIVVRKISYMVFFAKGVFCNHV